MNIPKRKSIFSPIVIVVLAILTISYLLADRYLIEHVEIQLVSASADGMEVTSTEQSSGSPAQIVTDSTATVLPVIADDWNYQSGDVSITVRKVTTGSGSDRVTYFVADVVLPDATLLQNAFADDKFGENIIAYTSEIAQANDAVFAINGDYYGFRTDGIVIRNGVIFRDVPARVGVAFYKDGTMKIYNETQTTAEDLLAEGVWNTLSFGPELVENGVVASSFGSTSIDKNIGNHSIQGNNPRTGVGIIDANHFIFIVVDGRSTGYSRGVTLAEFAQIFKDLGCKDAYNIDGGGSSTMYFMGRVVNNPLGRNRERGTSDIMFIGL